MLDLDMVTDATSIFGRRVPLLTEVVFHLPKGRYALLSETPEYNRPLIDILAGLRPPARGSVRHVGRVSWAVGRQGFVRGRGTGQDMINLVCALYNMDPDPVSEMVTSLLSRPDYLAVSIENWPIYVRQEFTFALALAPDFDIYIIDAPIPFELSRFTRLWQALFEQRLAGKTLILSTYRQGQMLDYCAKALVYERSGLRIDDDLEECIARYPYRPSREEFSGASQIGTYNGADDLSF